MDCLFPGTFQFSKVKWGAKFEYEYIDNYKLLQTAMKNNGVQKIIDA